MWGRIENVAIIGHEIIFVKYLIFIMNLIRIIIT